VNSQCCTVHTASNEPFTLTTLRNTMQRPFSIARGAGSLLLFPRLSAFLSWPTSRRHLSPLLGEPPIIRQQCDFAVYAGITADVA
jgi:hypothetical protein